MANRRKALSGALLRSLPVPGHLPGPTPCRICSVNALTSSRALIAAPPALQRFLPPHTYGKNAFPLPPRKALSLTRRMIPNPCFTGEKTTNHTNRTYYDLIFGIIPERLALFDTNYTNYCFGSLDFICSFFIICGKTGREEKEKSGQRYTVRDVRVVRG
jgi:hypothetical protein